MLALQRQVGNRGVEALLRSAAGYAGPGGPVGRPSPSTVGALVHRGLSSPGQPLDTATRGFMDAGFGHDFSDVRVHTDDRASASAAAVGSLAYTVGRDVVFARGAFAPETGEGRQLLAHELAHVVQQDVGTSGAASPSAPRQLEHPGAAPERQADAAAGAVLAGGRAPATLQAGAARAAGPATLARRADPALVAQMDQAAVRADPDYIENGLVRMEFFGAEQARLHYRDGASLLIGLVPRWIQPPLETVDYHTARTEYARVDGGSELKFIKDPAHLPAAGMTYADVLRTFTKTVRFTVDAGSGKIVPNHLNTLTAPFLCDWLRQTEAQYVREFNAMAEGMVKVFKVQKLIIELMLMRATIPGPKAPTPKGPAPGSGGRAGGAGAAGARLSAAEGGKIVGWGTGQSAKAVAQTQAITRSLTTEGIKQMIKRGLTKEWVTEQLALYERALAVGGAKLKNVQLLPRMELMKRLLELWPK